MNIALTPELEEFVERTVESGRYESTEAVFARALELLKSEEEDRQRRLEAFNAELKRRYEADRSTFVSAEEAHRLLQERIQKRLAS